MDFLGTFVGDVKSNIRDKFRDAKGGILFIDEAYGLTGHKDAIDEINYQIENNRDNTICIFAGYPDKMDEFLKQNPGLKSRISAKLSFPDYTPAELADIFVKLAIDRGFTISNGAKTEAFKIFKQASKDKDFGNGRFARKLLDRTVQNQSNRLWQDLENGSVEPSNKALFRIIKYDVCSDEKIEDAITNMGFV